MNDSRENGSPKVLDGEHEGCPYVGVLTDEGFFYCNKCGRAWEGNGSPKEWSDG